MGIDFSLVSWKHKRVLELNRDAGFCLCRAANFRDAVDPELQRILEYEDVMSPGAFEHLDLSKIEDAIVDAAQGAEDRLREDPTYWQNYIGTPEEILDKECWPWKGIWNWATKYADDPDLFVCSDMTDMYNVFLCHKSGASGLRPGWEEDSVYKEHNGPPLPEIGYRLSNSRKRVTHAEYDKAMRRYFVLDPEFTMIRDRLLRYKQVSSVEEAEKFALDHLMSIKR